MVDLYRGTIPIIDDDGERFADMLYPAGVARGYVERDYATSPANMFSALPSSIKLIPESEYDARFDEQEEQKSSLEHLYLRGGKPAFVNLDQNGDGHCWAYSTGHAIMLDRLKGNQPLVRLNPHGVAAMLKQLQGGWCGLSAKFGREFGYPVQGDGPGQWPLHSNNLRYDTPALRAQMVLHKVNEEFVDLTRDVFDQNMSVRQHDTCLFNNQPCPTDRNWWGHSTCDIRKVRIAAGDWGNLTLNSWLGWGRFGLAVIRGSKARPDGALSILVSGASDA